MSDTGTNLKFSDHTTKRSYRLAEDVLVTIGKFIFPVDFEIMDIPEDEETPIILGRPFLLTSRCNVDIEKGTLTLKSFEEEITLKVLDIKKQGEGEGNQASVGMIQIVGKSRSARPPPEKVSGIISKVAVSRSSIPHGITPKSTHEIKKRKRKKHRRKDMEVGVDLMYKVALTSESNQFFMMEKSSNKVWKLKYPP